MPRWKVRNLRKKNNPKNGFGVLEILIVIAFVSMAFSGVYQLFLSSTWTLQHGARKVEALYLAQEGIEVVRTLQKKSWTDSILTLTDGTAHYPVLSGNEWTLSLTDPGPINSLYTRTVVLNIAYRNADDDISDSGVEDPKTKKVTSRVTWVERGSNREVMLETYLTNYLNN